MSQVDLIVPFTKPDLKTWESKPLEEQQRIERDLWNDDMDSLRGVFKMLRNKSIGRILKLIVTDNLERPCSDEVIIDCLKGFDIRYLDWRKYDLSADVVLAAAPRVSELWLYYSGSSAILRGWEGSNGICNLNQVGCLTTTCPSSETHC